MEQIYLEDSSPLLQRKIFKQVGQHLLPDIINVIKNYIMCATCNEQIGRWYFYCSYALFYDNGPMDPPRTIPPEFIFECKKCTYTFKVI